MCGRGAAGPLPGASAILYLQSEAACMRAGGGAGATGGAFSAALAVHELIHTLDDGPTTGPNKCPDSGRHYCDDPNDILAPTATAATRLATAVLDSGRDDYYGTGGLVRRAQLAVPGAPRRADRAARRRGRDVGRPGHE